MQRLASLLAFLVSTSAAHAQCVDTFVGPATPAHQYGLQVAADGDRFLASAWDQIDPRVELRELIPGGATLLESLGVPAGFAPVTGFGGALAIAGDTVAVGHSGAALPQQNTGAVHLWQDGPGGWTLTQSITPADVGAGDRFGANVALDGDRLAVTALTQGEGAVYVFRRIGAQWLQEAKLTSPALQGEEEWYGESLDIDGDVLAIGTSRWSAGAPAAGRAYVYERGSQGWSLAIQLASANVDISANFGKDLSLDGDLLAVGEPGADGEFVDTGSISIFDRAQNWTRVAEVFASNGNSGDGLGHELDLRGTRLLVGSRVHSALGTYAGAAYVFEDGPLGWAERAYFVDPGSSTGYEFGAGVAQARGIDLVSAIGAPPDGVVFLVDPSTPGGAEAYCAVAPHSLGYEAELFYRGSTAVSAATLSLRGRRLVPSQAALLFYGPSQQALPLGDGVLCVGAPWFRLDTLSIGLSGRAGQLLPWGQAPVSSGAGAISAGSTWNFQMWFRDPGGANGSNLTNGLSITFCP